jgi:heat shock protein HslJ
MYCMDPEGVMDQEYAYLQSLGQAETYEISGGKLLITCSGDQVLAFAEKFGAELEGKAWMLQFYGRPDSPTAVIRDTEPTAEFRAGQVNGTAGCNLYSGSYQVDETRLTFGPLASTEMWCTNPQGVMEQEQAYLKALDKAERYEIKGGMLHITCSDDQVLTFTEE